ncbi:hemolysin III [Clostridia bacterium]|nr:hemolysin III [Clostridia bacterium]
MRTTLKLKDPGSAITHFIGMVLAMCGAIPLIIKAAPGGGLPVFSFTIFIVSMILLYAASTIYHTFDMGAIINRRLKKMDHMMIFVLIAGSYTPICLLALRHGSGLLLFALVWGIAVVGIVIKGVWIDCPKWFSSALYIGMGWLCLFSFAQLFEALSGAAFVWLMAGGFFYTVGGVIYALKLKAFNLLPKNFGSHEIFHLFVLAGSICHFVMMYCFLTKLF